MPMTDEKILSAVEACRAMVRAEHGDDLAPERIDPNRYGITHFRGARHLLYMFDEIPKMLAEGRHQKVHRWLGFAQGVLWAQAYASLDMLKKMNMPDPEPAAEEKTCGK